ncbi:hypothetical protein DFH06DRAFT_1351596 [Mycena polygramma]|nr:hypothetical protein DFH06DRAFT_1351596 [Mycena polygramma]
MYACDEWKIIDLYAVGIERNSKPFIQAIELKGPGGQAVQIQGTVDDGAMVGVLCEEVYKQQRDKLGPLGRSRRRLRMADGTIIPSSGCWTGQMIFGTLEEEVTVEVFPSGGSWSFLFAKPLLEQFRAVHDYETDIITLRRGEEQIHLKNALDSKENEIAVTNELLVAVEHKTHEPPGGGIATVGIRTRSGSGGYCSSERAANMGDNRDTPFRGVPNTSSEPEDDPFVNTLFVEDLVGEKAEDARIFEQLRSESPAQFAEYLAEIAKAQSAKQDTASTAHLRSNRRHAVKGLLGPLRCMAPILGNMSGGASRAAGSERPRSNI